MIKITWSQTSTYSLHISHLPTHSLTASSSFWLQRCMQSLPHRWRVADNEGLHGSLLSPCPQVCGPPLLLLLTAASASTQFLHGSAIPCSVLSCSRSFSHHFVQASWMPPETSYPLRSPSWEQPALLASSWAGALSWCLLMSALTLCSSLLGLPPGCFFLETFGVHWGSMGRAWLWSEISSSGPTTVVAMVPKIGDWILFSTGCNIYQMGIPIINSYAYFDKGISASLSILIFVAWQGTLEMSLPNLFFSIPITYITYVLKIKEIAGKERARLTTLSKAGNDIKYTCHLILPGLLYCNNL